MYIRQQKVCTSNNENKVYTKNTKGPILKNIRKCLYFLQMNYFVKRLRMEDMEEEDG